MNVQRYNGDQARAELLSFNEAANNSNGNTISVRENNLMPVFANGGAIERNNNTN